MTSSVVDSADLEQVREQVFLALFIALAVALHTFEALLPNPLPWFRLGLANIFAVTALFIYGVRALWTVNIIRILVGSLLLGNLFSPAFLLSFSGGILATMLMSAAYLLWRPQIGPVGVSVLGAVGHAGGQLLVAWLLIVRHPSLLMMVPLFLLFSLVSGMVNGLAADYLIETLLGHPAFSRLRNMLRRAPR